MASKDIGVIRGKVKISKHNPKWIESFEAEKKKLEKFGIIEHIGSTAIPDLYAKPIIDIAIGVDDVDEKQLENYKKLLQDIGYTYIREERPQEHLFVKGPESLRTHYLHMIKFGSRAWKDYLAFRDYLKSNKDSRDQYTKLKKELAKKFANDRKSYTEAKIKIIDNFIKKANAKKKRKNNIYCTSC